MPLLPETLNTDLSWISYWLDTPESAAHVESFYNTPIYSKDTKFY